MGLGVIWSRRKIDPKLKSTSRPHVVSDLTGCQRRFHLIGPSSRRAAAAWFHQSVAESRGREASLLHLNSLPAFSPLYWSNYPSLSFTDSTVFQSYVSCFAFLWLSELFHRIITHDKKNIRTEWHRLFTSSYHYHMCNGTPVRLTSPWRFVWLTLYGT